MHERPGGLDVKLLCFINDHESSAPSPALLLPPQRKQWKHPILIIRRKLQAIQHGMQQMLVD